MIKLIMTVVILFFIPPAYSAVTPWGTGDPANYDGINPGYTISAGHTLNDGTVIATETWVPTNNFETVRANITKGTILFMGASESRSYILKIAKSGIVDSTVIPEASWRDGGMRLAHWVHYRSDWEDTRCPNLEMCDDATQMGIDGRAWWGLVEKYKPEWVVIGESTLWNDIYYAEFSQDTGEGYGFGVGESTLTWVYLKLAMYDSRTGNVVTDYDSSAASQSEYDDNKADCLTALAVRYKNTFKMIQDVYGIKVIYNSETPKSPDGLDANGVAYTWPSGVETPTPASQSGGACTGFNCPGQASGPTILTLGWNDNINYVTTILYGLLDAEGIPYLDSWTKYATSTEAQSLCHLLNGTSQQAIGIFPAAYAHDGWHTPLSQGWKKWTITGKDGQLRAILSRTRFGGILRGGVVK